MSALTSLLVRDEVVSVRQIEDALARQVLEGGELDTALLELDAAPENVLNAYRAASFRLPAVAREEVMSSSTAVLSLLSHEQAEKYRAIPITHDSTTLVVATSQPLPEAHRQELGRAIGMQVECCIACEVRIEAALARFYRRPMTPRMERLAERIQSLEPGSLPLVEPILETPLSGLASELFDDVDESDELEAPPGAAPIPYESLKPSAPERVGAGHVVDGQHPAEADLTSQRSSGPPRPDTQQGFGPSSLLPPEEPEAARSAPPFAEETHLESATLLDQPPSRTSGAANDVGKPNPAAVARAAAALRPKRIAVPQGPLSRELAGQLLEKADDRDAVIEVFFRYARQYFDATALLSIREDRVLGREVHNVPGLSDIHGLSLSVVRGSALDELLRTLQPRVGDLARKAEDLPLADALSRSLCQPSALLPVCVQRRVVALVYGDRGGDFFRQHDLAPLIELLPEVSRAFERIIRTRKVLGLSARARSLATAKAELGHAATQLDVIAARPDTGDHEKAAALLRNARRALSALGVPRTAPPPPAAAPRVSATGLPRVTTTAIDARPFDPRFTSPAGRASSAVDPRSRTSAIDLRNALEEGALRPRSRGELEQLERIPTARLPAVDPDSVDNDLPSEQPPKPPAYLSKPPPGAGRYSSTREGEGDEPQLEPESDTKRLRKQGGSRDSHRPHERPNSSSALETVDSLEAPRFESPLPDPRLNSPRPSKPPPGTGIYHSQDVMSEMISLAPPKRRTSQPTGAASRSSQPPVSGHRSQPPSSAHRSAPPSAAPAYRSQPPVSAYRSQPPAARSVPRVSASDPTPTQPKRSSKRPPPAPDAPRDDGGASSSEFSPQAKTARSPAPPREATVIVDTLGQTRGLVDDLCNCGPDDESTTVQSLLRVGEPALDVLVERFPGPLWFDRRKPYARLPFGRDTGPIARALAAFGEAAMPRLVPLLRSTQPDVRYYATLFVSDQVHPDLLGPIAERLFDDDPQIRLMVRDALPAYRQQPGFAQVLGSLRTRMLEARAPLPARLAAIDGAAHLRDGASVPALIELLAHVDRQLSVPAHRALVTITCQDFGTSTKKWRSWFEENQHRHRIQWLIDSLMHGEQTVRSAAGIELQKVTQVYYGYVASAPKRDRERAQGRYQDWWDTEGRKKH